MFQDGTIRSNIFYKNGIIMIISKIAPFLSLLMIATSCATIMHGTRQTVGISSAPSCADVLVNRNWIGKTPIVVALKRNQNHWIQIELDGFLPYEIVLTRQVSGWAFGNVIFGGFFGLAVDAISGGLYRLTPEQVDAQLIKENGFFAKVDSASHIFVVMQPDSKWEKIGELIRS
jgi:hypothetical protein